MAIHRHLDLEHQAHSETGQGIRVAKITFFVLIITALLQGLITLLSGSAALLADTVHGLSNGLTTLPLWIAFSLARKKPSQRFPYGYYKAEDLAGLLILVFIAVSAVLVGYESLRRLLDQQTPTNLPWAIAAGALGFLSNEAIAQYRIRVGKKIDSAALVADGHHARVDGLGSLAVVLGLAAVALGIPAADPAAGLVITALIVYLLVREAGPPVLSRALDRIDPSLISAIQEEVLRTPGVVSAHDIRARWIGHRLSAELSIGVDAQISVAEGHQIAEAANHRLRHAMSKLLWCNIHVEPFENGRPAFDDTEQASIQDCDV
jgi:cation diffusion facilitator family transporter